MHGMKQKKEINAETSKNDVIQSSSEDIIFTKHSQKFIQQQMDEIEKKLESDNKTISAAELAIQNEDKKIELLLKQSGVEYSHTNTEIIGESKFESNKSKEAEKSVYGDTTIKKDYNEFNAVSKEEKEKKEKEKRNQKQSKRKSRLDQILAQSGLF